MLDEFTYGRTDASNVAECGSSDLPSEGNYTSYLSSHGFSDEEIVALANVEAFGVVRDPSHADKSTFPRFDNYYYKALLTSGHNLPHQQSLTSGSFREHVENFAEDREAFNETFKHAFVKLCSLGNNDQKTDIDFFLEDDPRYKIFLREEYKM